MIPVATLLWKASTSVPPGTLITSGAFVSQSTYANLFAKVGHAYNGGVDPGDGTFKLPDVDNRLILGKATAGTGSVLGESNVAGDHTHVIASHTHSVTQPDDHPAHAANAAHAHDAHTTTNLALAGGASGFDAPVTHSSQPGHTHGGAHSAHTGMAVGSAGGGTTGTGAAPRMRLRSFIYTDDYYGNPPVGAIVAFAGGFVPLVDVNQITGDSMDFEGGTVGGWTSSDATLTSSTDQAQAGTRSLKVDRTTTGVGEVILGSLVVEEGYQQLSTAFIRAATTVRSVTPIIRYYSDVAETVLLDEFSGDAVTESNSAWTATLVHGKAPAGAIRAKIVIRYDGGVVGEDHYLDTFLFTTFAWAATIGASHLRANLPDLFAEIGTTFGSVDADHFTLPDLSAFIPMHIGTIGATSGSRNHTHTAPSHTHSTTQADAHSTHTNAGAHTHDSHVNGATSAVNVTAVTTSPVTHTSNGSHAHNAHSAHAGASAASGGNAASGSANAPTMTVHYFIRAAVKSRTPFLVGMIHPFASDTLPSQYFWCRGETKVRTDNPALFNTIGTNWNTGGEAGTDFRLPDAQGRFLMGVAASGIGNTLASYFGAIDHVHAGPSHTHTATQPSAHSDHDSVGGHTHDTHATATRVTGAATLLNKTGTHTSGMAHAHDSHSAHTGFTVNAGGTENTTGGNDPYVVANYIILWQYEVQADLITEHVTAHTRQLVSFRTFSVITEHVSDFSRSLVLNRTFDVVTEHVTDITRSLVVSRSFLVTQEHVVSLTRFLVAGRTFSIITEHDTSHTRSFVASRTLDIVSEHVPVLTRQLGLFRSLDITQEHVLSIVRIVTFDRRFFSIQEHVVTAAVCMDFDDVPTGGGGTTIKPIFIFDDF